MATKKRDVTHGTSPPKKHDCESKKSSQDLGCAKRCQREVPSGSSPIYISLMLIVYILKLRQTYYASSPNNLEEITLLDC